VPSHQLQTIPITWPFSTWELDFVGPFKKVKGGFTHIFVTVDKFTKWATSHATGHTPFFLVYGSEAMLRMEVEHKSFQVQHFNEERSDDSRVDDLAKLEGLS
jgi:hypothetical protein